MDLTHASKEMRDKVLGPNYVPPPPGYDPSVNVPEPLEPAGPVLKVIAWAGIILVPFLIFAMAVKLVLWVF